MDTENARLSAEIASGRDVEEALKAFEERTRWEGYALMERDKNPNGMSLRELMEAAPEDLRLHMAGILYPKYRAELGKDAPSYIEWAVGDLLPAETLRRALAKAHVLTSQIQERYNERTDRHALINRLEISVRRKHAHVLHVTVEAINALINGGKGIYPGEVLHVVGGEGSGKTTLLLDILQDYIGQGGHALFLSLDMSVEAIATRLFQRVMNYSQAKVREAMVRGDPWYQKAREAVEKQYELLHVMGGPITMDGLRTAILASDADVIAIDYVTASALRGFNGDALAQATAMSDLVREISHNWGITFVLLSQVSRESARDMAKGGRGGHGMGGSALEQMVDYELELYRDVPPDSEGKPRTICTLRKNRNGPGGRSFELSLMTPSMEYARTSEEVESRMDRKSLFLPRDQV